jgi:hypothetical protein
MEWGIIMAFPTVLGMLLLLFAQGAEVEHQTFGQTIINPSAARDMVDRVDMRKAA